MEHAFHLKQDRLEIYLAGSSFYRAAALLLTLLRQGGFPSWFVHIFADRPCDYLSAFQEDQKLRPTFAIHICPELFQSKSERLTVVWSKTIGPTALAVPPRGIWYIGEGKPLCDLANLIGNNHSLELGFSQRAGFQSVPQVFWNLAANHSSSPFPLGEKYLAHFPMWNEKTSDDGTFIMICDHFPTTTEMAAATTSGGGPLRLIPPSKCFAVGGGDVVALVEWVRLLCLCIYPLRFAITESVASGHCHATLAPCLLLLQTLHAFWTKLHSALLRQASRSLSSVSPASSLPSCLPASLAFKTAKHDICWIMSSSKLQGIMPLPRDFESKTASLMRITRMDPACANMLLDSFQMAPFDVNIHFSTAVDVILPTTLHESIETSSSPSSVHDQNDQRNLDSRRVSYASHVTTMGNQSVPPMQLVAATTITSSLSAPQPPFPTQHFLKPLHEKYTLATSHLIFRVSPDDTDMNNSKAPIFAPTTKTIPSVKPTPGRTQHVVFHSHHYNRIGTPATMDELDACLVFALFERFIPTLTTNAAASANGHGHSK